MEERGASGLWRAVIRFVAERRTRLRRARVEAARNRSAIELALDIGDAKGDATAYREVIVRRGLQRARHSELGELDVVAFETWALASIHLAVGNPDEAREFVIAGLATITGAGPDVIMMAAQAITDLAAMDVDRHRLADAIAIYDRAVAAFESTEHDTTRLAFFAGLAEAHRRAWHHDATLSACAAGLAIVTDLARPIDDPYRVPRRATDGNSSVRRSWEIRPHVITLVTARAHTLATLGRFAEAENALTELQALFPTGLSELEGRTLACTRAWAAYRAGRYEDAERWYGDVAAPALEGETAGELAKVALAGLGWTYIELGMPDQAAGVSKRMHDCGIEGAGTAVLRAAAELARGRHGTAERWALHTIEIGLDVPLASAFAHEVVARIALARGRLDAALTAAETAVARIREATGADDPFASGPLLTLARVEAESGSAAAESRFREAMQLRIPELHPRREQVRRAFAEFLVRNGRADEATRVGVGV